MAAAHLDADMAGEIIRWYGSEVEQARRTVVGPCPHGECPHNALIVVAWGGDMEHYELVVCDVDDGCAGGCRGWWSEVGSRGVHRWMETAA